MRKIASLAGMAALALSVSACSGFINGHDSVIRVATDPAVHAHCTLENDKSTWSVFSTPGYVSVHRSGEPLVIECKTANNYVGRAVLTPKVDPKAVATDAVVGGAVGGSMAAVSGPASWIADYAVAGGFVTFGAVALNDIEDGALYKYAPTVTVTLVKDPTVSDAKPIESVSPLSNVH
jgi:hypothetical protein